MKPVFIVAILVSAACTWAQDRVQLRSQATVLGRNVRLSDLLPEPSSSAMRGAAENVVLGRAPEPGSIRVFAAREIKKVVGEEAFAVPEEIVVRRAGWRLNLEAIRRRVQQSAQARDFDLSQAAITLPAGFATRVPNPELEMTGLREDPPNRLLIATLRCHDRSECGSFLAKIFLSGPARAAASTGLSVAPVADEATSPARSSAASMTAYLVQPGRAALLVIEAGGMRITETVMPGRRGRLGEVLRVQDRATHRSLLAEVTGAGLLRPATAAQQRATR